MRSWWRIISPKNWRKNVRTRRSWIRSTSSATAPAVSARNRTRNSRCDRGQGSQRSRSSSGSTMNERWIAFRGASVRHWRLFRGSGTFAAGGAEAAMGLGETEDAADVILRVGVRGHLDVEPPAAALHDLAPVVAHLAGARVVRGERDPDVARP